MPGRHLVACLHVMAAKALEGYTVTDGIQNRRSGAGSERILEQSATRRPY